MRMMIAIALAAIVGCSTAQPDRESATLPPVAGVYPSLIPDVHEDQPLSVEYWGRLADLILPPPWVVTFERRPLAEGEGWFAEAEVQLYVDTVAELVAALEGQTGRSVSVSGDHIHVADEQARRTWVVPTYGVSGEGLAAAFNATMPAGTARVLGDRLVISVPANQEGQARALLADLGPTAQYLLEVELYEVRDAWFERLGVDTSFTARVALDDGSLITDSLAEAVLAARNESSYYRHVSTSRLHLIEGASARLQIGESVPIVETLQDLDGRFIRENVRYVDTGIILSAEAVGVDENVYIRLRPEWSTVTGGAAGRPVFNRRTAESTAVVEDGGLVVLGGFSSTTDQTTNRGWFRPGLRDRSEESSKLWIVARVSRL